MTRRILIRQNTYFDSIVLMQVSARMVDEGGLREAAAVRGTPANLRLFEA